MSSTSGRPDTVSPCRSTPPNSSAGTAPFLPPPAANATAGVHAVAAANSHSVPRWNRRQSRHGLLPFRASSFCKNGLKVSAGAAERCAD